MKPYLVIMKSIKGVRMMGINREMWCLMYWVDGDPVITLVINGIRVTTSFTFIKDSLTLRRMNDDTNRIRSEEDMMMKARIIYVYISMCVG